MHTRLNVSRSTDRRLTAGGLGLAVTFVVLAGLAVLLPPSMRHGTWLPLHLALAGAGGTAVAAAMPFFSAALTASRPADPRLRTLAIAGMAGGALLVTAGYDTGHDLVAALGGISYVGGAVALLAAVGTSAANDPGSRNGLVLIAYVVAVADVLAGATLATAFVSGVAPITAAWATLEPAHAWLNLLGFLSLVITASLIHLLPTVLGTRIRADGRARLAVGGTALGAPLVAIGFVVGDRLIASLGAIATLGGAIGLVSYGLVTVRARGRWTTDPGWHLVSSVQLLAAIGWYAVAVVLAAGRVLANGVAVGGWRLAEVAGPLVVGWVVGAILGAGTHLLPAVGPGDGAVHAVQRRTLSRWAAGRLVGFQAGTFCLSVGLITTWSGIAAAGVVLLLGSGVVDVALLARAAAAARRMPRRALSRSRR